VIPDLLHQADPGAQASALVLNILDMRGQAIYSNQSGQSRQSTHNGQTAQSPLPRPEVKISFSPVFRKWELGLGYQDTTIEGLARSQFRNSLLLTGFVLALLLIGILLTLRAATREVRL